MQTYIRFATALVASVHALDLGVQQGGKEWRSGEVMTYETYKYGKFIAKIKGDDKLGTCTSFFTFWKGDAQESWNRGGWSEIDIELVPSDRQGTYSTNVIWQDMRQSHLTLDESIANPGSDWAVYEFQWTPDYVSWLYNGQEVRKTWASQDESVEFLRQREQHLMMNFWVPNFEKWSYGFDPVDMPWYARYDYVEFWEYVPESEWATTEGANQWHPFKFGWKDDFDFLDESRWYVSENWTFPENNVTFWRDQVYTENGELVLKLEPRDGYVPGNTGDSQDNQDQTGDNQGQTGGSDGQTQDCGCNDLLDTIAQLRAQLAAFEANLENSQTACSEDQNNADQSSQGGATDQNDSGTNTDQTNPGTGSDQTGQVTVDNNFDLSFAIGTPAQQANVVYHNEANRPQNINDSKLRIINRATQPIWINYQAQYDLWPQTLKIEAGKVMDYKVPQSVSATRFWPKYQCDSQGENCAFGESGGPNLPCPHAGCSPPIDTKFEATFGTEQGLDWYNSSQVDGWTLPFEMSFNCEGDAANSADLDCSRLTRSMCPNQNIEGAGNVPLTAFNPDYNNQYAGCYSPCGLLTYNNWGNQYAAGNTPSRAPADQYCCAGDFDTPETCWQGPNPEMTYTNVIHANCDTYAWAYDDAVGLKACRSESFTASLTFYDPE